METCADLRSLSVGLGDASNSSYPILSTKLTELHIHEPSNALMNKASTYYLLFPLTSGQIFESCTLLRVLGCAHWSGQLDARPWRRALTSLHLTNLGNRATRSLLAHCSTALQSLELSHMTLTDSMHVDLHRFDRCLTRVKCHHSTLPRAFEWLKRCAALEQLELIAFKQNTMHEIFPKLFSWPHLTSLVVQRVAEDVLALVGHTPRLRHLVLRDCHQLDDTHLDQMMALPWIGRVSRLLLSPTLFTEAALTTLLTTAPRLLEFECTRSAFSEQFWSLVARRVHLHMTFADHRC